MHEHLPRTVWVLDHKTEYSNLSGWNQHVSMQWKKSCLLVIIGYFTRVHPKSHCKFPIIFTLNYSKQMTSSCKPSHVQHLCEESINGNIRLVRNVMQTSRGLILSTCIFKLKLMFKQHVNSMIWIRPWFAYICTPTKRSNAQHLVEYWKQMLYEENQKSGNTMQQSMDTCVCGINTSSESIYFSRDKHVPVEFWYTYFTRNVNLTIRENFLSSKFIPQT